MKTTTLLPQRPRSRRQMDRMRRQRMLIAVLAWVAIIAPATAATYIIATQGLELQFSLQIKA
ncbi:hypothetical protein [Comamonas sp. wu1-DMT]|uniref:hypothetical protein n=1 Tax=Comamonas sp. wu1-DMT TaxID=3126390 RepID=UPI0032E3AE23